MDAQVAACWFFEVNCGIFVYETTQDSFALTLVVKKVGGSLYRFSSKISR